MKVIPVTILVPAASIRLLMAEAPEHPATMTDRDIQQYLAGLMIAALSCMGPNGVVVAREMRLFNEDPEPCA